MLPHFSHKQAELREANEDGKTFRLRTLEKSDRPHKARIAKKSGAVEGEPRSRNVVEAEDSILAHKKRSFGKCTIKHGERTFACDDDFQHASPSTSQFTKHSPGTVNLPKPPPSNAIESVYLKNTPILPPDILEEVYEQFPTLKRIATSMTTSTSQHVFNLLKNLTLKKELLSLHALSIKVLCII